MNIENIVAEKSVRIYPLAMRGIGENVIRLRNARGWSQKELAKKAKVNVETVVRAEHDVNTSIDKLARMATALDSRLGELLPEDQKPKPAITPFGPIRREHELHHRMLEEILNGPEKWATAIMGNIESLWSTSTGKPLPSDEPERKVQALRQGDNRRKAAEG